ncbi:MAG: glycosyltransferase family 4 protein, partial [Atribacterota bacterium]|nr:glycosyltransferase family 4 protein [Atribacterota bacterium]
EQHRKSGHEVFILAPNSIDIVDKPGLIKFGIREKSENWDFLTLKRLISSLMLLFLSFRLIKRLSPDVVHSHSADLGFIISFACRLYRIPMINQCHGVSFPYKQIPAVKRIVEVLCLKYSGFNKIVTVDENSLSAFKKLRINNVCYMDNGVDLEKFKQINKKRNEQIIFLFVGRLEKQKGLNYLIKALNILKKEYSQFMVWIIGRGSEEDNLKRLVKKYDLQSYIKFLGNKSNEEISSYYLNSDVFILPSIWEGFPLTLLEAWAAGLPVIISDVGNVSEICWDGENALIVPPGNSRKITEAMKLLINNESLREKLGENGKKLVAKKYSWEKISKEFETIYKDLLTV